MDNAGRRSPPMLDAAHCWASCARHSPKGMWTTFAAHSAKRRLTGKSSRPQPLFPFLLPKTLLDLGNSLTVTLQSLQVEERFILSSWFLDQRTLHEIAEVLRVHEATVSRQLKRLTSRLHKDLLKNLQASGMSRRAAEETLGMDPRDLTINLRSCCNTRPLLRSLTGRASGPGKSMTEHVHPGPRLDPELLNAFVEEVLPEHERQQCLSHFAIVPDAGKSSFSPKRSPLSRFCRTPTAVAPVASTDSRPQQRGGRLCAVDCSVALPLSDAPNASRECHRRLDRGVLSSGGSYRSH